MNAYTEKELFETVSVPRVVATLLFSVGSHLAREPFLYFLVDSRDTYAYAESYLFLPWHWAAFTLCSA